MTNFEKFKKRIWKCAQDNDRRGFDKWCMLLMQKGVKDFLWRFGWSICPENAEAVFDMFTSLSLKSHKEWLKAIGRGDAPPEDVSPAEGYLLCAKMIKDLIDENMKLKKGAA